MNDTKLSSDEVPTKFAEWLLSMGCPAEKVPSADKIAELCRGQYYMVWRSLMDRVEAKDAVRFKRMQVFCDDLRKCQKKNVLNQRDSIVEPNELALWLQQQELRRKVDQAKTMDTQVRSKLDSLLNKIGDKMAQRDVAHANLQAAQRRAHQLQTLAAELAAKRANLRETRAIATAICGTGDGTGDVQIKLDKYLSSVTARPEPRLPAPLASSSVSSGAGDGDSMSIVSEEQHLVPLVQCAGDALSAQLYARRAALLRNLSGPQASATGRSEKSETPQSVLAHTAALHCNLALEAAKNKVHLRQAHRQLVNAVTELNTTLSGESCELLVLRCERAHAEARVEALKALVGELAARSGVFYAGCPGDKGARLSVAAVDKAIESKRDELKKLINSLTSTELKIQSVRECLTRVFGWLQNDSTDVGRFGGIHLDLPQESVSTLRQFYELRREAARQKVDLSLELDASEGSVHCATENPRFPDELRHFLSKFKLEKNRQLVLESGEKIWIFETIESSVQRLYTKWLAEDLSCNILSPSDSVANNLRRLALIVHGKAEIESALQCLPRALSVTEIDITRQAQEEDRITDKVKKRLQENLILVQKTNKAIETGKENLRLWSENKLRKYISPNRQINGIGYKAYESWYLDNFVFEK